METEKYAYPPAEISEGWRLLTDRLERETDPRVRANLEVVAQHVLTEIAGDIPALMATLVPHPAYRFEGDAGTDHADGQDQIRGLYERAVATGRNRREFNLALVVADQEHVVTEGTFRQIMRASEIEPFGILHGAPIAPGAWYLTEKHSLIVWPITKDGLIQGEEVYGEIEKVVREVQPHEFPLLGPVDRLPAGMSG